MINIFVALLPVSSVVYELLYIPLFFLKQTPQPNPVLEVSVNLSVSQA